MSPNLAADYWAHFQLGQNRLWSGARLSYRAMVDTWNSGDDNMTAYSRDERSNTRTFTLWAIIASLILTLYMCALFGDWLG
jgi:hypothetical protein